MSSRGQPTTVVKDGKYGDGKMTTRGKTTDGEKELRESLELDSEQRLLYEQVNKRDLKLQGNKKFLD